MINPHPARTKTQSLAQSLQRRICAGSSSGPGVLDEQWSEIDPHVEPVSFDQESDGRILVDAHQIVRDLSGTILADMHVGHRFSVASGLIQDMEVGSPPSSRHGT